MIMKLLPAQWGDHAELLLRTSWSTAWGGGKVINALLFNGERIVPESAVDMRRNAWASAFPVVVAPGLRHPGVLDLELPEEPRSLVPAPCLLLFVHCPEDDD